MLFVGEVTRCQHRPGAALLFHEGRFCATGRPRDAE
jgi:hypothetical protein